MYFTASVSFRILLHLCVEDIMPSSFVPFVSFFFSSVIFNSGWNSSVDIIHSTQADREAESRRSAPWLVYLSKTSDFFIVSGSEGNYW